MLIILTQFSYLFFSAFRGLNRPQKELKFCVQFFIYFSYVAITGLRWKTGTDWSPYIDAYNNILSQDNTDIFLTFEPGFILLAYFVKIIFNNYNILLIINSLIVVFFVHKAAKLGRIPGYVLLTMLLLIQSQFFVPVRQQVAIAICLYAVVAYTMSPSFSLVRLILFVGFAAFFHLSALFSFIFIGIKKDHLSFKGVVIFTLVFGIFAFLAYPYASHFLESRIQSYVFENEYEFDQSRNYLRLVERVTSALLLFFLLRSNNPSEYHIASKINYKRLLVFGLLLNVVSLLFFPYLARLGTYLTSIEAYFLAYLFWNFSALTLKGKILFGALFSLIVLKFAGSLIPYWDLIDPYYFVFESSFRGTY